MTTQIESAVLIGYGSVGRRHARALAGRYRKLAVLDLQDASLESARSTFPDAVFGRGVSDLDDVSWDWGATLGVIATWGPSHASMLAELSDRGVKHILCEKPLATSVKAAHEMINTAGAMGITLGVNHHIRYSGLVNGLNSLAGRLSLGSPVSMYVHGGANGIVTRGIHQIDLACELFDRGPESVVSSASGDPINPRSPDLMFYGGTAIWDFGDGKEVTFSFSNQSSITRSLNIYYRDAVVIVGMDLSVEVRRRLDEEVKRYPSVTRTGEAADVPFRGPVTGIRSPEERMANMLDEIESRSVEIFPPTLALQALSAVVGALAAGRDRRSVSLPISPDSHLGGEEWPIS